MTREGGVFYFDGQADVNMDVFVASPAAPEIETGKYAHTQRPYAREVGFDPKYHREGKLQETQLFLQLKQQTGKGYVVLLYPRLKAGNPASADVFLMWDIDPAGNGISITNNAFQSGSTTSTTYNAWRSYAGRHFEGESYSYYDRHVKWLKQDQGPYNSASTDVRFSVH